MKGKRQVVRSLTARIQNQFNVAVAEAEDNDLWQRLTIVACCVSNDASHANQILSRVVSFIEESRRDPGAIGLRNGDYFRGVRVAELCLRYSSLHLTTCRFQMRRQAIPMV